MPLATYALTPVTPPSRQEAARAQIQIVRDPAIGPVVQELASPDGRWLLGERDHNLYARSTYDGREVPLTTDGADAFEWRIGGPWSPDSSRVAVLKKDEPEVWQQPIVHYLKQNDEVSFARFTKAGDRLALTQLYVLDLRARTQVKAQLPDEADRYLAPAGWLADGSELLFYQMGRTFKKLQLLAMNPQTGAVRTILEETQPTFIKGLSQLPRWDLHLLTLLDGGKRFLFISERDGWDHLYLYAIDGTLVRRLTTGAFPVLRVVDVDPKAGWVYFMASAEARPYDMHLYRVNLDGTGFKRLTEGEGTHDPVFSPDKAYFLDSHSSFTRPRSVDLRAADGRLVQTVS
jgi:Tol biopolymer transport system component